MCECQGSETKWERAAWCGGNRTGLGLPAVTGSPAGDLFLASLGVAEFPLAAFALFYCTTATPLVDWAPAVFLQEWLGMGSSLIQ